MHMRRFTLVECVSTQDNGGAGSCRRRINVSVPVLAVVRPTDVGESFNQGIVRTCFLPKPEADKQRMTPRSASGWFLPLVRRWPRSWAFWSHVATLFARWRPSETSVLRNTAIAPGGCSAFPPTNRRCPDRKQPERWNSATEPVLPPIPSSREAAAPGARVNFPVNGTVWLGHPGRVPLLDRGQAPRRLTLSVGVGRHSHMGDGLAGSRVARSVGGGCRVVIGQCPHRNALDQGIHVSVFAPVRRPACRRTIGVG